MNVERLEVTAGWVLLLAGLVLAVASLTSIGELAQAGALSPQQVANRLMRQPLLVLAFLGGNLTFLSWTAIGYGLAHTAVFPPWSGWVVGGAAIATWLSFLHVPGFQQVGGPLWPLAVALCGIHVIRIGGGAA